MATILVGWYIFCALLIVGWIWVMRFLTHSKFRDDHGDRTTEVGYEEDPVGHDLESESDDASNSDTPPIVATPPQTTGSL